MLSMNSCTHPCHPGRNGCLEGCKVARVYDGRSCFSEQAEQAGVKPYRVSGRFIERQVNHVRALNARKELRYDTIERDEKGDAYGITHFADCPQANKHRRKA